jgi:hypothetical protein
MTSKQAVVSEKAVKPPSERWLKQQATRINEYYRRAEATGRESVRYAAKAGEYLAEVKGRLRHGEWLLWLDRNFDFSERTAQTYLRVAEEYAANPKRVSGLGSVRRVITQSRSEQAPRLEYKNTTITVMSPATGPETVPGRIKVNPSFQPPSEDYAQIRRRKEFERAKELCQQIVDILSSQTLRPRDRRTILRQLRKILNSAE